MSMTSSIKFYYPIQIILQIWSRDQSLVTLAFYDRSYDKLNFIRIRPEKTFFFEGWSWNMFNNFWLKRGIALKFYTSLAKGLKTKSHKVLWANSKVCRSYKGKTGTAKEGGVILSPPAHPKIDYKWLYLHLLPFCLLKLHYFKSIENCCTKLHCVSFNDFNMLLEN